MRIASFNVENLFHRARALDHPLAGRRADRSWRPTPQLNDLFEEAVYTEPLKARILDLLESARPAARRRQRRVRRAARDPRARCCAGPSDGTVEVVADGRADWVGWVDLTNEPVDELAMRHTAMVIRDLDADVLGVVEAENRPALQRCSPPRCCREVGGTPYEQVMLVDGNDDRGIDVGILAPARLPARADPHPRLRHRRPRACSSAGTAASTTSTTPGRHPLVVLVNHFKSKGYASPAIRIGASAGAARPRASPRSTAACCAGGVDRRRDHRRLQRRPDQRRRWRRCCRTPTCTDISDACRLRLRPAPGTFGSGNEKRQDRLRPAVAGAVRQGHRRRHLPQGRLARPADKNPWPMYHTLTAEVHAASDHAAIYADIDLD